jgi:hypothetical protein
MKLVSFLVGTVALIVFIASCKNGNHYAKQVKELDSLKVVLQEALVNFNTIDSAKCYQAYTEQSTYSTFINANLRDTVSKQTAENLQLFYAVGKNLVNYLAMSPKWKAEAKQSIKQLTDLSHDLKNGSVEEEEVVEFISEEKIEADKIIEELKSNTELMRYSLESFSKSLPTAQETVKKLNGGSLPALIQPEIKKKPKKH